MQPNLKTSIPKTKTNQQAAGLNLLVDPVMYTLDFGVPALIQGKKRVGRWVGRSVGRWVGRFGLLVFGRQEQEAGLNFIHTLPTRLTHRHDRAPTNFASQIRCWTDRRRCGRSPRRSTTSSSPRASTTTASPVGRARTHASHFHACIHHIHTPCLARMTGLMIDHPQSPSLNKTCSKHGRGGAPDPRRCQDRGPAQRRRRAGKVGCVVLRCKKAGW